MDRHWCKKNLICVGSRKHVRHSTNLIEWVQPWISVDSNHLRSNRISCFMMNLLQDAYKMLFRWCLWLLHRSCLPGLWHRNAGVQRAMGTTHATPPVHGRAHHPRRGDRIAGSNHAPCMLLGGGWESMKKITLSCFPGKAMALPLHLHGFQLTLESGYFQLKLSKIHLKFQRL